MEDNCLDVFQGPSTKPYAFAFWVCVVYSALRILSSEGTVANNFQQTLSICANMIIFFLEELAFAD